MPIYSLGKKIIDVFKNNEQIRHGYYRGINVFTRRYHLNIFPTPNDATVTIGDYTHQGPTGSNVWLGYETDWSVEKEGYGRITGTWKATKDEDLYVTLRQDVYSFSIKMGTPARANITWIIKQNGVVTDQTTTNNVTNFSREYPSDGLAGITYEYRVAATGYATFTGTWDPFNDGNYQGTVNLTALKYQIKINPTPANATVKINGAVRNTYSAVYNEKVTWSVSATGYTAQSGSLTCTKAETINVTLKSTGGLRWCYVATVGSTRYYLYTLPAPTVGGDVYGYGKNGTSLITICTNIPSSIADTGRASALIGANILYFKVYATGSNYIQTRPEGTASGHQWDLRAYRSPEYDLYK